MKRLVLAILTAVSVTWQPALARLQGKEALVLSLEAQSPSPIGTWVGRLNVGAISLRLVLHVDKQPDGTLKTTVDSPDQGANGYKTSSFSVDGDSLTFGVFGGKFDGKFSADGKQIVGTFTQRGNTLPLTLERSDKPIESGRPQDPKPPFPYDTEDVAYENMTQYVRLAGTITKPKGVGPFPAVLLITGSGAENRNEEIMGHRPFWVIADYLTRRGIEVLRVDDRGVGGSSGSTPESTSADFVTDVLTGVQFLKSRPEVDKAHIGLIGHSEGGLIGPMAASQCPDVAFVVMMAGPGMSGRELLPLQAALVAKSAGASDEQVSETRKNEKFLLDKLCAAKDPSEVKGVLAQLIHSQYAKLSDAERKAAPSEATALNTAMAQMNNRWFRYFLTVDPRSYLEKVKCPVLAIDGEKDVQVPGRQDLDEISFALQRGGNTHFKTVLFPNLNHLFQTARTGSPSEYAAIDETIAPVVLKTIGDWIWSVVKM